MPSRCGGCNNRVPRSNQRGIPDHGDVPGLATTLWFDRGTLLLHPTTGKAWIDYCHLGRPGERFRLPALHYRRVVEALRAGHEARGPRAASVRSPSCRRLR